MILTLCTTRGDIALALYSLREEAPMTTELFTSLATLASRPLEWPVRSPGGVCCTALPLLEEYFPELARAGLERLARGFLWNSTLYIPLDEALKLLGTTG